MNGDKPFGSGLTVAIGGLGSIGYKVASALAAGMEGLSLVAVAVRDRERARARLDAIGSDARIVPLADLAQHADIVVECAPAAVFAEIAVPAIEQGRILVPATVGGLLSSPELMHRARESGARIVVPTGAIAGLDAVRAAAVGKIERVTLASRKPPRSLAGAPGLAGKKFNLDALDEPTCVFHGNALEAAKAFPANVNVAAALALASVGPERTMVEIWADPTSNCNVHTISVSADSAQLSLTIEVKPSPENPRSSMLAPLSIIAALRSIVDPIRIGS